MRTISLVNFPTSKYINEAPQASASGIFFFACRAAFGDCSHPRVATRGIPAKNKGEVVFWTNGDQSLEFILGGLRSTVIVCYLHSFSLALKHKKKGGD